MASRRAILVAAEQTVREEGYAAASIDKIARRAGAGKQTIYRWYGSKAELFLDVYETLAPDRSLHAVSGNAQADLGKILRTLFRFYRQTVAGQILSGLIAACPEDSRVSDAIGRALVVGRGDILRAPLTEAVASGDLPDRFDQDDAIETLIALVWYRLLMSPEKLTPATADRIARRAIAAGMPGS